VLMGAGLLGLWIDLAANLGVSSTLGALVCSGLSDSLCGHSQLTSDRAVEGALSISPSLSFSDSSDFVEVSLVLLVLLSALLTVLVRCNIDLLVCGGEARLGETSDMVFKKSRYATGGVMGVFCSSNLSPAL
jgi:hypothetical protein